MRATILVALLIMAAACGNPVNRDTGVTSGEPDAPPSGHAERLSKDAAPAPGQSKVFPPVPIANTPPNAIKEIEIKNGDFDEPEVGAAPAIWIFQVPGGDYVIADDASAHGRASLRIHAEKPGTYRVTQNMALTGHRQYLFRCKMLAPTAGGGGHVNVIDSKDPSRFGSGSKPVPGGMEAWRLLETEFELPANVSTPTLVLRYNTAEETMKGPVTVWFDDCRLYDLGPRVKNNLVQNSPLVYTNSTVQGWRPIQTYDMASETTDLGPDIPRALRISTPKDTPIRLDQTVRGITPAKTYMARLYIKTDNLDGGALMEIIGVKPGEFRAVTDIVSDTTDWTWASSEFTTPPECRAVRLQLVCRPRGEQWAKPGKVWFAAVELFEI